jgi:hypothetical protein
MDDASNDTGAVLAWVLVGFFVIVGYAIPIELLRGGIIPEQGVYFALGGGTIVLLAILVFVRLVYFEKNAEFAYLT